MPYTKRRQENLTLTLYTGGHSDRFAIFFIVTMQFKQFRSKYYMPEIKTAGVNQVDDQIIIAIDESGGIFFNGIAVTTKQLSESLVATNQVKADFSVLIMADEETELKVITEVMDLCRNNQLNQIRLHSRCEDERLGKSISRGHNSFG